MTVRTLVIDDSRVMRTLISRLLDSDPEIEVIGTASDTVAARSMIKELDPDVVTLDIEMPGMNGLDFLEKIMRLRPMPVVMVSTLTQQGAYASVRALELGAVDCFPKPANGDFAACDGALAQIVKQAGRSRVRAMRPAPPRVRAADYSPRPDALIAIGASTGGVEALVHLISQWPADCPPTLIVQHMPPLFTSSFAARLDRLSAATVAEATSGAPILPGHVYLAPGGERHLEILRGPPMRCRLVADAPTSGHRPSVDRLFHSVAKQDGLHVASAILTGMGSDGAKGMKALRDAGALTIGQEEGSCVVYGMPGSAAALGAVAEELPIERIAARLLAACAA